MFQNEVTLITLPPVLQEILYDFYKIVPNWIKLYQVTDPSMVHNIGAPVFSNII